MTAVPYSFVKFLVNNTNYPKGLRITKKLIILAIINDLLGKASAETLGMKKQNVSIVYKKAYGNLLINKPSAVHVSVYLLYLCNYKICKLSKEISPLSYFPKYNKSWDGHHASTIAGRVKYRIDNREYIQKYSQQYQKNNSDKIAHISAKRRAAKLKATPLWLTAADNILIENFYTRAKKLQEKTGIPYHVDHIVPLQGKNVCGLHVPWNLQVITAEENLKKSNNIEKEISYHCKNI